MGQAKSGTCRILEMMTVCGSHWPMSTYSGSHEANNGELFLADNVLKEAMVDIPLALHVRWSGGIETVHRGCKMIKVPPWRSLPYIQLKISYATSVSSYARTASPDPQQVSNECARRQTHTLIEPSRISVRSACRTSYYLPIDRLHILARMQMSQEGTHLILHVRIGLEVHQYQRRWRAFPLRTLFIVFL